MKLQRPRDGDGDGDGLIVQSADGLDLALLFKLLVHLSGVSKSALALAGRERAEQKVSTTL